MLCFSNSNYSQSIHLHSPDVQFIFEDSLLKLPQYHSVFKPIEIPFEKYTETFGKPSVPVSGLFFRPAADALINIDGKKGTLDYNFGEGFYANGQLSKHIGFYANAGLHEQSFSGSEDILDTLNLVPGYNRPIAASGSNALYFSLNGELWWQPVHGLRFAIGKDKHFWGDGVRSLFLSENAASYPYLQTQVKLWKIQYVHQVLFMSDIVPGNGDKRFRKYISMHLLDFKASQKFSFHIFEAVIWRKQDTLSHRNFDVQYLNPFIFYRPVEYNMGSPDNVIMGVGTKVGIGEHSWFYGQLMLDEFRLQELKANNGWWGNKYGYQVGFKTYGVRQNRRSLFQIEYNLVRPYTYSHSYSLQNYGYLYRPLAHPAGSNFRELLADYHVFLKNRWILHARLTALRYGTDPAGENMGSDIYKRQWTFTSFNGNYTGQGIAHFDLVHELSVTRMLIPSLQLAARFIYSGSVATTEGTSTYIPMIQFGLKTMLYE